MAATVLRSSRVLTNILRRTGATVSGLQDRTDRGYADMAFTFASPATVFYKAATNVKQVDVPSFSGSFGILPNHVPLLAVLRPGVITVHEADGQNKKYFVSSGSITVNDDSSVQILAEEACTLDQLDSQAIREGAAKAAQDLLSASTDFAKAEASIALECYDALQKAVEHP
uniref:F-ATPase delta subunit n=1 Tax=Mesenchytraeus solifugus TaxID=223748 RepID=A0A286Q4X1_MESSO|nr:mitochondrial ATP synthase subunit delta precursor [Mesenchytraeus solifugus]